MAELTSLTPCRARARWRHRGARGLHPSDPARRRARADPPGPARPDAGADDARRHLRPADRRRLRSRLVFSWGGNPGVGSLHRLRDAVEHGWPRPLELEEHSHAGMAAAYAAGAANLPFGVLRGYRGTDLPNAPARPVTCPFTGEQLAAVPAHRPDVGIVHAQQADRHGNVQLWGIVGVQKEVVLASARSIVTVEELVDELEPKPQRIVIPGWVVDAVCVAPAARIPRTRTATTTATTASTSAGTRSAATATRSRAWIESQHVLGVRAVASVTVAAGHVHRRRHDGRGGGPAPAGRRRSASSASGCRAWPPTSRGQPHAPDCVLIYESGTIGAKPTRLPLSIGDGELAETADTVVSVPEMFGYWLQGGRIDVGFLGAAQIDRYGNLNSTVIGPYYGAEGSAAGRRRRTRDRHAGPRRLRHAATDDPGVRRAARLPLEPRRARPRRDHRSGRSGAA